KIVGTQAANGAGVQLRPSTRLRNQREYWRDIRLDSAQSCHARFFCATWMEPRRLRQGLLGWRGHDLHSLPGGWCIMCTLPRHRYERRILQTNSTRLGKES